MRPWPVMASQISGYTPVETKLEAIPMNASFEKVRLVEPVSSGYVHLMAEVDSRLPFLPASRTKRDLLKECKRYCSELERRSDVKSAVAFRAILIPPGRGEFLKQRPGKVHIAKFDVVILIETNTVEDAEKLRQSDVFVKLEERVREVARYSRIITASNVKRIGSVDHNRDGVFLFNYFFADDTNQNLAVWEYTAGWFQQESGLDNSTVLLPNHAQDSEYNIVNHCRWDHLRNILPSLLFKRSFRSYVLSNFEANNVAAIPILFKLA